MRFRLFVISSLSLVTLASLGACGGGSSNSSGIPDDCNPLGGQACMLPWPSTSYLEVDSTTTTGYRVALPADAMPINEDPTPISPDPYNRWDGFSPSGTILAAFPTGVSGTGLPPFADPDQSLAADSPIILLNMDTGDRAPFFAEIDQNEVDITKRDLIIRPLARLQPNAHYAVAIRNTVTAPDGTALPIPPAFAAIVAGKDFSHPKFAALEAGYADIYSALSTAGVDNTELVLAWDFRTASDTFLRNDLTTMRDVALPAIGSNGANLTFTTTTLPNTADSYLLYTGTFSSPTFLTDGEQDDSIMNRDANGNPLMVGMRQANFAAIVPACVTTGAFPLPRHDDHLRPRLCSARRRTT